MKILFVGCGNMGYTIAKGMIESATFTSKEIDVVLPINSASIERVALGLGLTVFFEYHTDHYYDLVIFTVKPNTLDEVLPYYQSKIKNTSTLIISIAAGKR